MTELSISQHFDFCTFHMVTEIGEIYIIIRVKWSNYDIIILCASLARLARAWTHQL